MHKLKSQSLAALLLVNTYLEDGKKHPTEVSLDGWNVSVFIKLCLFDKDKTTTTTTTTTNPQKSKNKKHPNKTKPIFWSHLPRNF